MHRLTVFIAGSLSLALIACGDDPVSESAPVGLSMKVQSSDVAGDGTVTEEKSITTESGNPWGKFVDDARATIGGDPSDITVDDATIVLETSSTNVTDLGEVFDGLVTLTFEMNGSINQYTVADGMVAGADLGGEVPLTPRFDFQTVVTDDVADLLGGSFKVILTGPTHAGFAGLDADADLQTVFTFSAFE
jgi:hypothetical protein